MTALATAFACVWIAFVAYIGWLRQNQRRLAARVNELSAQRSQLDEKASRRARAA
jgi:CcmD family protein